MTTTTIIISTTTIITVIKLIIIIIIITVGYFINDCDYFKVIQKIREQHTRKP